MDYKERFRNILKRLNSDSNKARYNTICTLTQNDDECKCQHKNVGFMENKYVRKMTFLFSIFFNFPQSNIASGL